jgi:hypothetical protein
MGQLSRIIGFLKTGKPADRRHLMRAHTLSIELTLTMAPLLAAATNEDEFCTTVTDTVRRMNAGTSGWLDRSTPS